MENRPKTSQVSIKSGTKRIPSVMSSKSSKTSPLQVKRAALKPSNPTSSTTKDSNSRVLKQQEPSIRPYTGAPQHRRVKSDPISASSNPFNSKPLQSRQKNTPVSNTKEKKSHRRTNSDASATKNSQNMILQPSQAESQDREHLISIIKNSFVSGVPLITNINFYKLGKPLGKGAFGKVYLGIHKLSGLKVAIKTIEKSFMQDERTRRKVFQEVYIMNKIHDLNVIRLLELFESPRHLMIVLEYAGGGDLLQLLRSRGKLSENEARPIFRQIIDAVSACHKEEIIHRDIKLDNILLNEEMTLIKLCDFGVSRLAKPGSKINEQCGTPAYLAPEIIVNEGYEPFFVDI